MARAVQSLPLPGPVGHWTRRFDTVTGPVRLWGGVHCTGPGRDALVTGGEWRTSARPNDMIRRIERGCWSGSSNMLRM